ncbi:DNA excision repair protein ERCC-1-like 2, partial [Homarus americanus]
VDVKDPHHELKQLTKICLMADMTLILAWDQEEAGRIIEVYKMFEHKPPDLIMEKQDANPYSMLVDALTSVRSINRTDAMTLLSTFGSLEKIIEATEEELSMCPGFGPQKATRLHKVLHQNFKKPQYQKKKPDRQPASSSSDKVASQVPESSVEKNS